MAHLIFIARNRDLSSFLLAGPAILGRSVECDIYTPDIFVSRQHCRFEKTEDGWVVIDQRSRNGIYFAGRRFYRRVLKHGDLLEVGSFSVRFNQGDIPATLSTMTPFGEGTAVASLMDTLYAGGLRPSEYVRRSQRKPAWVRAREDAEAAALRLAREAEEQARVAAERLNFCDGCELDIEAQIAEDAAKISPQYVLVARESVGRLQSLHETSAGATVAAVAALSGESIAGEIGVPRLPDLTPATSASGNGQVGGMKNLFEGLYKEVGAPGKTGKLDKKAAKEAAKAEKEAERQQKKQAKSRPDIESYSVPIGERVQNWYAWAKTVDVSLSGVMNGIRSYPKQFAIAASVFILLGGGWGLKEALTPKYRKVDTSHMTEAERKKRQQAIDAL